MTAPWPLSRQNRRDGPAPRGAKSVAACFCFGLAATALPAETPATGRVNNPSASEQNVSATEPVAVADELVWRQQQIAAAKPVTSKGIGPRSCSAPTCAARRTSCSAASKTS
jgi:hypothetical protein